MPAEVRSMEGLGVNSLEVLNIAGLTCRKIEILLIEEEMVTAFAAF